MGEGVQELQELQELQNEYRVSNWKSDRILAKARCEMSRRDDATVAWHEVPGIAPLERTVP
jgi:hypothetical protein